MKRSELKKVLKPLIKECVREVVLDEGILSGIISEVARGIDRVPVAEVAPVVSEASANPEFARMQRNAFSAQQTEKLKENKSRLMEAIGADTYNGVNLFDGTTPMKAQATPHQMASPLATQEAGDAGVNISNLFGAVGQNWGAHMNEIKERK